MRAETVRTQIALLLIYSVLILSSSALAQTSSIVRVQGRVMSLDLYKNEIIVNEKIFMLSPQTRIKDEKEHSIGLDRLKREAWVYVVGENNESIKKLVAKKIYVLPNYIQRKERHLYSFMDEESQ